jgi:hypothetical protein
VHKPQKRNKTTPKKQSTNKQSWYKAYNSLWSSIEVQLEVIYSNVQTYVHTYIHTYIHTFRGSIILSQDNRMWNKSKTYKTYGILQCKIL